MAAGAAYDVVVAGASIAGCTAARLLGLAGARVALVEKRPDAAAYKVTCTHQIQASATPTIERIGLGPQLEQAGAARNLPAAWSPYGGWLRFSADSPRAWGITRRRLDPTMRELAASTPGVDLILGRPVSGVKRDGDRVAGVEIEGRGERREVLSAAVTVAADGRDSAIARMAGVCARVLPHNRFAYFGYWTGVETAPGEARLWFLEPDGAAVFPNEEEITTIVAFCHRSRLAEFRADPDAAYERFARELPDGPSLDGAERISKLIGKLEMPNKIRLGAPPGLAFTGDAALATDPLFGVGCGWALQSSEWLADELAAALLGDGEVDPALRRYRRTFLRRLGPHHLQIADFSTGRRTRFNERVAFRAAARDERIGSLLEEVMTRRGSFWKLCDPRLIVRTWAKGLRPEPKGSF